jgi:hypothetical protein
VFEFADCFVLELLSVSVFVVPGEAVVSAASYLVDVWVVAGREELEEEACGSAVHELYKLVHGLFKHVPPLYILRSFYCLWDVVIAFFVLDVESFLARDDCAAEYFYALSFVQDDDAWWVPSVSATAAQGGDSLDVQPGDDVLHTRVYSAC